MKYTNTRLQPKLGKVSLEQVSVDDVRFVRFAGSTIDKSSGVCGSCGGFRGISSSRTHHDVSDSVFFRRGLSSRFRRRRPPSCLASCRRLAPPGHLSKGVHSSSSQNDLIKYLQNHVIYSRLLFTSLELLQFVRDAFFDFPSEATSVTGFLIVRGQTDSKLKLEPVERDKLALFAAGKFSE